MTKPIIYELLEEIDRNVAILESLRKLTEDEFVTSPERYLLAERCFQLSIQCVLDISLYLASQQGWQRPATSADAVELMGRQGVLKKDFADRIVDGQLSQYSSPRLPQARPPGCLSISRRP